MTYHAGFAIFSSSEHGNRGDAEMIWNLQQTDETMQANAELREAVAKASEKDRIIIWWKDDDGDWHDRHVSGEAMAKETEERLARRGVQTRRG